MKEYKHYKRLEKWLASKGFSIFEKIRYGKHEFDIVGINDIKTINVEVKEVFFQRLIDQAKKRLELKIFDYVYIAYPFRKKPKVDWLAEYGIGVIDLSNNEIVLSAKRLETDFREKEKFINYLLRKNFEISIEHDDYYFLKRRLKKEGFKSVEDFLIKYARYELEVYKR